VLAAESYTASVLFEPSPLSIAFLFPEVFHLVKKQLVHSQEMWRLDSHVVVDSDAVKTKVGNASDFHEKIPYSDKRVVGSKTMCIR
jgi:hypothetical protein